MDSIDMFGWESKLPGLMKENRKACRNNPWIDRKAATLNFKVNSLHATQLMVRHLSANQFDDLFVDILPCLLINHPEHNQVVSPRNDLSAIAAVIMLQSGWKRFLIEWLMYKWGSASIERGVIMLVPSLYTQITTSTEQILLLNKGRRGRSDDNTETQKKPERIWCTTSTSSNASRLFKWRYSDWDASSTALPLSLRFFKAARYAKMFSADLWFRRGRLVLGIALKVMFLTTYTVWVAAISGKGLFSGP